MPAATAVALLINPTNPQADAILRNMHAAAHARGLQLRVLRASTETEMETAFAGFADTKAAVLTVGTDSVLQWPDRGARGTRCSLRRPDDLSV